MAFSLSPELGSDSTNNGALRVQISVNWWYTGNRFQTSSFHTCSKHCFTWAYIVIKWWELPLLSDTMFKLRHFILLCLTIIVTSFSKMSTPAQATGNLFKSKQCITLDLAKQIASAAAQEVIFPYNRYTKLICSISQYILRLKWHSPANEMHFIQAVANNWSVVCCILDDGGNIVYLVSGYHSKNSSVTFACNIQLCYTKELSKKSLLTPIICTFSRLEYYISGKNGWDPNRKYSGMCLQ